MGYNSVVTGEICYYFSPETKEALEKFREENKDYSSYWLDEICEDCVNLHAEGRAYNLEDDINKIIDVIKANHNTANGSITRFGEDNEDIEKFVIEDNNIRSAKAVITFPDLDD